MRRTASETIRDLEQRIARLEGRTASGRKSVNVFKHIQKNKTYKIFQDSIQKGNYSLALNSLKSLLEEVNSDSYRNLLQSEHAMYKDLKGGIRDAIEAMEFVKQGHDRAKAELDLRRQMANRISQGFSEKLKGLENKFSKYKEIDRA